MLGLEDAFAPATQHLYVRVGEKRRRKGDFSTQWVMEQEGGAWGAGLCLG